MAASFWGRDAVRPLPPVGERGDDRLAGAVFHSKSAPCARAPVHAANPCNHLLAPCCFLPVCQKAATARQTHCTCATLAESAICLPAKCRKKLIPYPMEVINLLRRVWLPFGCSWMLAGDSELFKQVSTEFFTQWWSPIASRSWSIWGQLTT